MPDTSNEPTIWLSDVPATDLQRRRSLILMVIMLAAFVAVVPFATVRLPGNSGFIPIIQAILFIADLITAVLIYTMHFVVRSRALLVLASGYLFSAIFLIPHTLTFPNVFAPEGLLGPALQTTAWLYVISHFAFPASVIGYVALSDRTASEKKPQSFTLSGIICSVGIVIGLVCVITWALLAAEDNLPRIFLDRRTFAPLVRYVALFDALVCGIALFLLWFRQRSVLDQWLTIAIFATLLEQVMQLFAAGRFDVGWYSVRIFSLVASTVVLLVLLAETANLYAKLVRTLHALKLERSDRLVTVQAATGALAHEIRQPLAAITANGEAGLRWMKRRPPRLKDVTDCLDSIVDASHRANEVITSVRRLFDTNPTNRRTTLQVNDMVREALGLLEHDLQDNGISLTTEFPDNLPEICVDHTQIQQIIFNLIKNAIEAMRSCAPEKRSLKVITASGNSCVSFYIKDSGPGIGAGDRDRIFDPFFTTKQNGTGLGLSICRTVVERHGGKLRLIESNFRGTVFEVVIPVGSETAIPSRV
jgi:signal transduction histidine kinase